MAEQYGRSDEGSDCPDHVTQTYLFAFLSVGTCFKRFVVKFYNLSSSVRPFLNSQTLILAANGKKRKNSRQNFEKGDHMTCITIELTAMST